MIIKTSGDTVNFRINMPQELCGTFFLSMKEPDDYENEGLITKKIKIEEPKKAVIVPLLHEDTKDLCGEYQFDIRFKDIDGNVTTCISDVISFCTPITTDLDD